MAPPLLISVLIGLAVISLALKLTSRGPFALDHKVIIITGGGCGIGRALAEKIWRSAIDITLVLLDINDASLAEVKTHLEEIQLQLPRAKSSKVLVYRCDVSDEPSVAQCISSVCEAVAPRRIGVLVNNAGIVNGKAIGDLTPQQLQRVFGVNVFAHFHLVRHVLPSMKKADHDTLIVSVASMFGYMYGCKLADYCASKAAVVSFHNCLRLELENDVLTRHIRTLLVCPLGVDTGMFTGIFDGDHGLFHLQQILAPVLTPSQVVASVYDGIVSGKVQLTSCHPGVLGAILNWLTPLTKLLPVPVQDYLAYAGGAVHGMDTFQGRQFNPQVAPTT